MFRKYGCKEDCRSGHTYQNVYQRKFETIIKNNCIKFNTLDFFTTRNVIRAAFELAVKEE